MYRCILNKADQVDRQKLMRVYGALMWSLGKVVKSPEVLRVYIGSFWDQPLMYEDNGKRLNLHVILCAFIKAGCRVASTARCSCLKYARSTIMPVYCVSHYYSPTVRDGGEGPDERS